MDPALSNDVASSTDPITQGFDTSTHIHISRSTPKPPDPQSISRFLLYRPLDVIKHTLKCTTRLATSIDDIRFRRHFKSRFPVFNRPRLQETYATDTWFASSRAIDGYTCTQPFNL